MRKLKFSGRESSVLRAIDFSTGTSGMEIMERTLMDSTELLDIANRLLDLGYIEALPAAEQVSEATFLAAHFEINPAFAGDLRAAILRR